jgi:GTP-binding protein EngB required for normal cell division
LYSLRAAAVVGGTAWQLSRPPAAAAGSAHPRPPPVDEAALRAQVASTERLGIDATPVHSELEELVRRRHEGRLYVAVFGEISSGKSSLIAALLPGAEVQVSPLGGTTREVRHYHWQGDDGLEFKLSDLPGLNEADGTLDQAARDEALRAHVILYVCDGDLSRSEIAEVERLRGLAKPLMVVVNKSDLYRPEELRAVTERVRQRLGGESAPLVVPVTAGGHREVLVEHPDGRVEERQRAVPARVESLHKALREFADSSDLATLESSRERSVLHGAGERLAEVRRSHRKRESEALVRRYARKAMLGALAAIGPGTDVLVQGYLGTSMLKELCTLYEVPAKEMDLNRFLELATRHVDHRLSVVLAIAGNVLKAFPGAGTVTGGLVHAVAYGLIFDSLGRSAARALESRGEITPGPTLKLFEETLGENLESRARRLAQLVLPAPGSAGGGSADPPGPR